MSEIDIDLRCCSANSLLQDMREADIRVDSVFMDPPWKYDNAAVQGGAEKKYDVLDIEKIAGDLILSWYRAKWDTYAVVWCTFPKIEEWLVGYRPLDPYVERSNNWEYVTGGAWGKTNGLGPGFHVRGDAELWLLYKKGQPHPLTTQSNLILDRRIGHSEKPQEALHSLVELTTPPGGLVLDLYAGETASLARACRATGRRYIGAEIDPERHARALDRLALAEQRTFWGWRREPIGTTE